MPYVVSLHIAVVVFLGVSLFQCPALVFELLDALTKFSQDLCNVVQSHLVVVFLE